MRSAVGLLSCTGESRECSCGLGCLASQMEPWLPTGPPFCPQGARHNLGQVLSRCERQAGVLMTNSEVAMSPDGAEMSFSGKLIFIGRLYSLDRFSSLLSKRCVKGLMVHSRVQSRTGAGEAAAAGPFPGWDGGMRRLLSTRGSSGAVADLFAAVRVQDLTRKPSRVCIAVCAMSETSVR